MFGWYKLKKFSTSMTPWDREYEGDGVQWDDPEVYRRQLFYPLLMKYLQLGNKYLDAGSGLGGWLAMFRARGFDVTGIERSQEAVDLVKRVDPSLPIQQGNIDNLNFEDASFDGYISIGSWEYFEDGTEQLMNEAKRVLKPGGILLLEVPYANPFRRLTYLPLKSLEVFVRSLLGQKASFAWYIFRKGDLTELLKEEGFELEELNPHDLPDKESHYGLYADWFFLRGDKPYRLNALGMLLKNVLNSMSPWMIATGMFIVAKKK